MLLAENIAAAAAGVNTRESNLALPADSAADRMILEVLPLPWRRHMPVRSTDRNLDIAAAAAAVENILPEPSQHLVDYLQEVDNWDMRQFPRRKMIPSRCHRYTQRR